MDGFVGKYVCYGNKGGLFCWGKIKAEVVVNTVEGRREAFVLSERMSGPYPSGHRIRKWTGDTVLRKDQIDLKHDVFDRDVREFQDVTNDELFLLVMDADVGLDSLKSRGQWNMLKSGQGQSGDESFAATLLKKRLGMDRDEVPAV